MLALLELELEQLELVELEHTEWMGSLVHNLAVLHILLECWLVVGTLVVVQRWWALVGLQMGCCILVLAHHTQEELAQVGCMLELQEQELVAFVEVRSLELQAVQGQVVAQLLQELVAYMFLLLEL